MRCLFVSGGGFATVHAVAPLAWAARSAGHEVLVATPREDMAAALAVGLPTVAVCELSVMDALFRDRDGVPLAHPTDAASGLAFAARSFARQAAASMATLLDLAATWRPDIVVGGAQSHAAGLVAAHFSLPYVRQAWDVHERIDADLAAAAAELAPELGHAGVSELPEANLFVTTTPPLIRTSAAEPALSMRFVGGGPQIAREPWMHTRPVRPRVLITSGSRAHLVPAMLGVPFLGALVTNPALAGCEVVVATDNGVAAELRELHPHVRAGFVPLDAVLETCDLVVHHGGGVTATAVLAAGVPQLALPVLPLSLAPMRRIDAAGAGITLDSPEVGEQTIGAACAALLGEPSFAAAAAAVRDEIAGLPSPAEVVGRLDELAGVPTAARSAA